MTVEVFNARARDAMIVAACLLLLSGCKAGRNGVSTMGPEPKAEHVESRAVSATLTAPTFLTVPTFLSLIGNKNSSELQALPTSVRVLLASQTIVGAPKSAAVVSPVGQSPAEPVAAAPELWNGKSRGGVAAEAASSTPPGWIWEPPAAPLVPPVDAAPPTESAKAHAPFEKLPVEKAPVEKAPVEKAPVDQPVEDRAPIERVENTALPDAQQPQARAQLATPGPEQPLKRDEVLLIACLVVLAVILATFFALLRYRAEHTPAHDWRRLR